MLYLNHLFQLLPVVLAIVAAVSCAIRFAKDRRRYDKWAMLLGTLSSLLLIVAQTSWWTTYIITNSLQGTVFANTLWTVFNSTSMVTLILISQPWRLKND